jgi:ABC-type branched-subunit amino acid transport system substrate-binding protein
MLGGAPGALPNPVVPNAPGVIGRTSGNVALLVPLTGTYGAVGAVLVNAAKLAFPGGAGLDVRDTGGTPQGAAQAAQAAIAAGDGVILGPLTSPEVHAVAPLAQAAGVNELAFTNDGSVAAPGVWAMGITPMEQVQRIVQYANSQGRTQLAALLPDTDFGHRLADALSAATAQISEPSPQISFFDTSFSGINAAVKEVSQFASRGEGIEAQIKKDQDLGTAQGREDARQLQHQPIPPPPFNALFVGATDAATLAEIANFLPYYYVNPPQVQFLGPAAWGPIAAAVSGQGVYRGALFAAPDSAGTAAFGSKYAAVYGAPAPAIGEVGFDAAAIAASAAKSGGFTTTVLCAPAGFAGADGTVVLQANGQVQRGLAVFSIGDGGATEAAPAPSTLAPSG